MRAEQVREARAEDASRTWEQPPLTWWVREVQRKSRSRVKRVPGQALVVDDDPEVRRALVRWLEPELTPHAAASVREARSVIAGLERVDLAFVDFHLPDGSGEDVLEALARWPDVIAILISGAVPATGAMNLLKNRALAHLVLAKPITPRVVQALKRAALASSK